MTNGLYHKEVKWNKNFESIIATKVLGYCTHGRPPIFFTNHANEQLMRKNINKHVIDFGLIVSGENI